MIRTIAICTAAIAAFASLPAAGQAVTKPLEVGIESSTELVSPPSAVPSQWAVPTCPECRYVTLQVHEGTGFFVGKQAVSLSVLQRYAAREASMLDFFYDPQTLRLNRVILRASLDAADVATPTRPRR